MESKLLYIILFIILVVIMMIYYSYNKRLKLVKIIKKEIEKINE